MELSLVPGLCTFLGLDHFGKKKKLWTCFGAATREVRWVKHLVTCGYYGWSSTWAEIANQQRASFFGLDHDIATSFPRNTATIVLVQVFLRAFTIRMGLWVYFQPKLRHHTTSGVF